MKILPFEQMVETKGVDLSRKPPEILQMNVGYLCNLACLHCHVEAGPKRTELMTEDTARRILNLLKKTPSIHTVDITGGSPEMNPHFRWIVSACRELGKEVIDRCNLTIFDVEGYEDFPEFLASKKVKIVASLPCYSKDNVEKQRGTGVFDGSIKALIDLNGLGYGKADSDLTLDLVYNPIGASLPPGQEGLEKAYKERLREDFGIEFNRLYTITNMPIKRFLHQLKRDGKFDEYMTLLVNNFNPQAAGEVMCRNLVSIGWDGKIFDCDFNQMLEIPLGYEQRTVFEVESLDFQETAIALASHCYGCTAGAGSSCGGALVQ